MNLAENRKPIAISLNFDSLNEAYGFPKNFKDPSFGEGFGRLAELCAKYSFPLSIYVIGKDLSDPERASAVKEWSAQGHEIGNHSWSHHFNLGSLSSAELKDEVHRSHDLISETIGIEPKGFVSPCWSTSAKLVETLLDLDYLYDTSAFPSFLLYPMVGKIALNHWKNPLKGLNALRRKDWLGPIKFPNIPFYLDSKMKVYKIDGDGRILILPLPSSGRLSPAIWHTIGFMFGWNFVRKAVTKLAAEQEGFYYLIHPADFLGVNDINKEFKHSLERMDVPLTEKLKYLDKVFSLLKESRRPVKTMKEIALEIKIQNNS
jgi:peptidoglycan-N-acetylglucosamine deacetylase